MGEERCEFLEMVTWDGLFNSGANISSMAGEGRYGWPNGFGKGRHHDVEVLGEFNGGGWLIRRVSCGDVATQAPGGLPDGGSPW